MLLFPCLQPGSGFYRNRNRYRNRTFNATAPGTHQLQTEQRCASFRQHILCL